MNNFETFLLCVGVTVVIVGGICLAWQINHAPCDHDWEEVDDSFDHEYGTEQIHYRRCLKCGLEAEAERDSGPIQGEDY